MICSRCCCSIFHWACRLAVIEGNADLLAEDEALTPEQREQVEAILRGTEQTRTYLLKIRAQVQTPLKYKRP